MCALLARPPETEARKDRRLPLPGRYEAAAVGLIAIAVVVRLGLISQGWPHLNSDEGVLGLMARHIAYRGDHPIFEYGQSYMSAVEADLAAGFFHLIGPSLFSLRLGLVILFALFLAALYALATLLYSRTVALVSVGLLALGSHDVLFRQLEAEGGIQEMLAALAIMLLLAAYLVVTPVAPARRRTAVYLGLGLAAGLSLYFDPFSLPYVMAALAVLTCVRFAELARRVGWLAGGFFLGLSPALLYNLTTSPRWATVLELDRRYRATGTPGHPSWLDHIAGTVLVALPDATGGSGVCTLDPHGAYPISSGAFPHVLACTAIHGVWGACVLVLWAMALVVVIRSIRQARRSDPIEVRRQAARLMLIGGSGLTILAYLVSAVSATNPWGTQRYLIGLWLAVPALIAPIFTLPEWSGSRASLWRALQVAFVATLLVWLTAGTVGAYTARDETADNRWAERVVADLEHHRLTRFYTDYWTCYRLAFLSQERLTCRVLTENLRPGWDRNAVASTTVERNPGAAYVFPGRQPWVRALAAGHMRMYPRFWLDGYIVYSRSAVDR